MIYRYDHHEDSRMQLYCFYLKQMAIHPLCIPPPLINSIQLAYMMQTDPQTRPKSCSEIGLQAAEMTVSAHELRAHLFHQYPALTRCLG